MQLKTILKAGLTVLLSGGVPVSAATPDAAVRPAVRYEGDIKPLLELHCLKCHGPEKQKGGLRLDHPADAF